MSPEEKKERRRESSRRWYAANREKHCEAGRRRRAANPEANREACRRWRSENPEAKREADARWRAEHPEAVRERNRRAGLKRFYGLTLDDYDQMVEAQGGCCALCEQPFAKLEVDHSHVTGAVRGLLCRRCNQNLAYVENQTARDPLGKFGPQWITNALNYLCRANMKYQQQQTKAAA